MKQDASSALLELSNPSGKDDQHILVMGDSEKKVLKAKELIDAVLYADETTRHRIRLEQLRTAQVMNSLAS